MKELIMFVALVLTNHATVFSQITVQMEKSGGVYKIPCKVNGLGLKFILDTGASNVSLSLTEALFMLKNDYLTNEDFQGTEYYKIANGDIQEGTKVNLRVIEIGGRKIYNVQASIVHTSDAPLLFGQSAMQRFGKFSIDYSTNSLNLGSSGANATSISKDKADKTQSKPKIASIEIGESDFSKIYFGTLKDAIWRDGKKVEFVKDSTSLAKGAYFIPGDNMNIGEVKLDVLDYIFDDETRFYKVLFEGSINQKEQMKSFLTEKYGGYNHEGGYDDIHIEQWNQKNFTITMRVKSGMNFEVCIEGGIKP